MRPFVDFGTGSFSYLAWSQLANEAAVSCYMSGGRISVPVTFHLLHGVRGGGAAQHSHSPQSMLCNAPGLEIVAPSNAADVYGLTRAAFASNNPTVIVSHAKLLGLESELGDARASVPIGQADVKRHGRDATIVANSLMTHYALQAAERLAAEGIEVEVVSTCARWRRSTSRPSSPPWAAPGGWWWSTNVHCVAASPRRSRRPSPSTALACCGRRLRG
jgi:pyruvate/2-oxoglutarate/acetoin dehydrogenase E1 component